MIVCELLQFVLSVQIGAVQFVLYTFDFTISVIKIQGEKRKRWGYPSLIPDNRTVPLFHRSIISL